MTLESVVEDEEKSSQCGIWFGCSMKYNSCAFCNRYYNQVVLISIMLGISNCDWALAEPIQVTESNFQAAASTTADGLLLKIKFLLQKWRPEKLWKLNGRRGSADLLQYSDNEFGSRPIHRASYGSKVSRLHHDGFVHQTVIIWSGL